jgi:phosphate transport system substrate-binding protein
MKTIAHFAGVTFLAALAGIAIASEQLTVNPTPHLLLGGMGHANQAFEEKTGVKVSMPANPKGCGATVLGLKSDKLDAGVMCCPPNKEEMGDLGLVASAIAKQGVVINVHDSNPVTSLSTEQLRDIYQGRIANWKQVGGNDAPMSVYGYIMCPNREEPARQYLVGIRDYKNGVVGIDNAKLSESVIRVKPGIQIAKSVAVDPNGIGFEAPGYLPVDGVKIIQLDGITASPDNVADGTYPAMRHLYIVTKGYPEGRTREYIDFLRSSEGQDLLAKEGKLARL